MFKEPYTSLLDISWSISWIWHTAYIYTYTEYIYIYIHLRHSALSEQLSTVCLQEGSMFPLEKYRGNGAFDNVRWNLENGIVICNWSVECCWIAFKKARAQCGIESVKWYVPCLETSTNCRQQDFLSSSVRLQILLWHNPWDDWCKFFSTENWETYYV